MAQLLAEMSHFDKDWRNYLRQCRILNKISTKCAKGPQVMAQLLAEMSHFDKDSNKMRQRAASYSAITCGNVGF
jgi:hypothetical protein